MINRNEITGIVLAGGKSSRMGTDKGLLDFDGKKFVQRSIAALQPLVSRTLLVSNNPEYDIFETPRVEDLIKNAGPLAGIHTGLFHSDTNYNLVLSCDIPLIKTEILEELISAYDPVTDVVQIVSNGKKMPLIALYHKRCENLFYGLLQKNERRLHVALDQCKVKNVILNSAMDIFTSNINTPEELKLLEYEAAKN
ncbi:molybdenum cofactor guanylyltransferase [Salinimicrobium soli]|uniref:molybdenum cofactor guanylyltransferase n=1 Tax=Salinimicrobium soli TaxID=1254399 RepID=UPI003AAFA7F4